jgi:hypothetical protein
VREAQCERIWAIASARQQGLSIRQIAVAAGLSPARVHHLRADPQAANLPVWLSQGRARAAPARGPRPSEVVLIVSATGGLV